MKPLENTAKRRTNISNVKQADYYSKYKSWVDKENIEGVIL